MRDIDSIIIHCSYTPPSMDIGAGTIRRWHVDDNGWSDIGYHYVIRRDGTTEAARPVELAGAHAKGHNANSIGICIVGGRCEFSDSEDSNYTCAQMMALEDVVRELCLEFNIGTVLGHRDHDDSKTCPNFDVTAWMSTI